MHTAPLGPTWGCVHAIGGDPPSPPTLLRVSVSSSPRTTCGKTVLFPSDGLGTLVGSLWGEGLVPGLPVLSWSTRLPSPL